MFKRAGVADGRVRADVVERGDRDAPDALAGDVPLRMGTYEGLETVAR